MTNKHAPSGCDHYLFTVAYTLLHVVNQRIYVHVADVLSAKLSEENPAIFVSLVVVVIEGVACETIVESWHPSSQIAGSAV